jgi:uncharacterized MAPEG superfamily protein
MTTLIPTQNLSLYSIPLAWLISLAPHVYATTLHDSRSTQKFDNSSPRKLIPSLSTNQSLDTTTKETIIRAEAAQQNGFENLGLFAAAVVAANVAKVDAWWMNVLSLGYLGSRAAYNVLYVRGAGGARTVVFLGGVGVIFTLFIQAGNKIRGAVV